MKQVVQDFKTGEIRVIEVPPPVIKPGFVLVKNACSAISVGTERGTVSVGAKSLIGKAKARPDLVKKVIDTAKKEGLLNTLKKVKSRLEEFKALGYSSSGVVIGVGDGVDEFVIGDRVACGGGGYAVHAEVIVVPKNLCVKIPDEVSFEQAAFTTIGAIALQGLRQADAKVGENIGVIGLGLIGLLTVQLLKSAGCRVFGVDLEERNLSLAEKLGADLVANRQKDDVISMAYSFSNGYGLDSVIITAGTRSSDPVKLASKLSRDKGKIVVVGAVGMELEREPFYEKELELKLSRSYGPGRYDPVYEEKGIDYPVGYVRWTEKRNMEAFVQLLAQGKLEVSPLITHKFKIENAAEAYDLLLGKRKEPYIAILLEYPRNVEVKKKKVIVKSAKLAPKEKLRVGVIGAGNFAKTYLLPHLKKNEKVILVGVATAGGATSRNVAERFGFEYCTTDYKEILSDRNIDAVVIATRHNLHANIVKEAILKGKAVFVEKPLALNETELLEIANIYKKADSPWLLVGFNRRFSPHASRVKDFLAKKVGPYVMNYRVNAGFIDRSHWIQDPDEGGGRIIGEVCHFVDTLSFFSGCKPVEVYAEKVSINDRRIIAEDNVIIVLKFEDGSIGQISYIAVGDSTFPKERIEIFGDFKVAVINDFKESLIQVGGKRKKFRTPGISKGHREEMSIFVDSLLKGSPSPIEFDSLVTTTLTTFRILKALREGTPQKIEW